MQSEGQRICGCGSGVGICGGSCRVLAIGGWGLGVGVEVVGVLEFDELGGRCKVKGSEFMVWGLGL